MGIMTADEKMTVGERRKVLKKVQRHCDETDRNENGRILNILNKVLWRHCNCLGRFLNGELKRWRSTRQQRRTY